ncbi:MAG TPA: 4Fe-4S binding protein [Trebonia sp.]|jgi:ferredoxin--NADP+ reductase|nr:4Fe-4S binding protein [Trebonia sp.]
MAYAITQSCCADASCVSACPVNCIHPTPDEPGFGTTDMLFIDPVTCIDCGACADACPVDAARPADVLTGPLAAYVDRNREYYEGLASSRAVGGAAPEAPLAPLSVPKSLPASVGPLRVAVVGTGPSAGYTVRELLRCTDADITLVDRNPVAGGLVRFGVAPDHTATKRIGDSFARSFRHPRVSAHLGVEVGRDITPDDLLASHHAVVYATGAGTPRVLGIPGEDLPGNIAATDFLGWSNGAPGAGPSAISLAGTGRAVVVGNGNVAIDVARLLLSSPERLEATAAGMAPYALAALRDAAVSEVVLLARRGPADAAFAPKEFLGLRQLPGLEIVIDGDPGVTGEIATADRGSPAALLRDVPVKDLDWTGTRAGDAGPAGDAGDAPGKRLVLRFHSAPVVAVGEGRVETVRVSDRNTGGRDIPAGLLIRSIGNRGAPIPGLPFDDDTGIIPNTGGRIVPGSYVTGWAKRGATGGIGANRACAAETVGALIDDAAAGRLPVPGGGAKTFARRVRRSRR